MSALAEQRLVYAGLNEESLPRLNRAVDDRSNPSIFLRIGPDFDNLRKDQHFITLLKRFGEKQHQADFENQKCSRSFPFIVDRQLAG